jgi:hypothetical protein
LGESWFEASLGKKFTKFQFNHAMQKAELRRIVVPGHSRQKSLPDPISMEKSWV